MKSIRDLMTVQRAIIAMLVLASCSRLCLAADAPTNVLLIITDEHNFRTLGCYRQLMPRDQAEMWGPDVVVQTPHIDRLSDEGVTCTRAYGTSPVCSPSRAAMITRRYPHVAKVPTNNHVLDRSIPTLADRLDRAGYRTAFIGKWHLAGEGKPKWSPEVDGGFQFTKYMFNRGHWKKFAIEAGQPKVAAQKKGKPTYDVDGADEKSFSTDWLTDRTIEFITDKAATKPFLAVVSYPDPHGPNTVRVPYDHRFDDLQFVPPKTYRTETTVPGWLADAKNPPVFRVETMSKYFGMVQCIDDCIGRLLQQLKQTNRLDNTLIIFTSDHGDLCYEHDRLNKGNPYEGSARIPMIFRYPGRIAAGQVYTQPIGTVDLTPTIMGLLKLPSNADDQGRNLSAELTDASQAKADDAHPPVTFLRNSGTSPRWVAAVDARYKLILSVNDKPWLFDAKQDPDELRNFYGTPETQSVTQRLARALRDYGKAADDPYLNDPQIAASLVEILGK